MALLENIAAADESLRKPRRVEPNAVGPIPIRSVVREGLTAPVVFGVLSLAISLGFFLEGTSARFSSLSGDQLNILAVCAKMDHPELLQGDLIAGDVNNVKYYIPVFVNVTRLLSLPDHNYVRGLNILLLMTSLVYMWGWWLLFSVWGDKWLATIFALLVRGIMWPPGNELWGIAGLWSMLPRTLFLALLPWVLWGWFRVRRSLKGWLLICFAAGLIGNVHPISGLSLLVALSAAEFLWGMLESKDLKTSTRRLMLGVACASIGLSPFIWTYWSVLTQMKGVNPSQFYEAVRMRINPVFFSPWSYSLRWAEPKWIVLIFLPWVIWFLAARKKLAAHRNTILALGAFTLACMTTALLPFLIEALLNKIGYNVHFAFQLVRTGKYIIVPSILLWSLLCWLAFRQLEVVSRKGQSIKVAILLLVILLTAVSRDSIFDRVPLLGDDVSRFLWPSKSATHSGLEPGRDNASELQMDETLDWIKSNTPENAKFVGPRAIRAGALRAVIHDFAGAGMLIEGNPRVFVAAAAREKTMREPEYADVVERSKLIASWGADYWVTRVYEPRLSLCHAAEGWFTYDLHDIRAPK
jgi:hypothetical protein